MEDAQKSDNLPRKHGFQPGEVANPKGRPKGAKGKLTILKTSLETAMVEQLHDDVSDILQKAVHMAKKGDKAMIKFLLERFLPKASAVEEQENKGIGGINIIVQGMEPKEVIIQENADAKS